MFILSNKFILTPSKQGGSKTVSSTHKHITQGHTLTIDEMPSHKHSMYCHNFTANGLQFSDASNRGILIDSNDSYKYNDEILQTGGSKSHSHGDTGNHCNNEHYVSVYYNLFLETKILICPTIKICRNVWLNYVYRKCCIACVTVTMWLSSADICC